ncbi:unnamed protein product [Pleuronectes platessa]|uniref:Uncharacterized protein n=1 Tax=Pleuronectes platessa TaxID=8262 RepID=A0A9N7VZV2_PLEPL|nr:unnamed protein product [Pleuronectes platessa]
MGDFEAAAGRQWDPSACPDSGFERVAEADCNTGEETHCQSMKGGRPRDCPVSADFPLLAGPWTRRLVRSQIVCQFKPTGPGSRRVHSGAFVDQDGPRLPIEPQSDTPGSQEENSENGHQGPTEAKGVLFLLKEEGGHGLVHLASRGAAFRLLVGAPKEKADPDVLANRTGGVYSCPI